VGAGTRGNVVRVLMPLVISVADFDEGLDVMEAGLAQVTEIVIADTAGLAFAKR
jgi:4-aminobutyrate aminotransferase-like enzyme